MGLFGYVLQSIQSTLGLKAPSSETAVAEIQEQLLKTIDEAVADGTLSSEEFNMLYQLNHQLGLSEEQLAAIHHKAMLKVLEKVVADRAVTDEEYHLVRKLKAALELSPDALADIADELAEVEALYKQKS
jgi:polyhydroxyalkanoate synthesis regulator phasin